MPKSKHLTKNKRLKIVTGQADTLRLQLDREHQRLASLGLQVGRKKGKKGHPQMTQAMPAHKHKAKTSHAALESEEEEALESFQQLGQTTQQLQQDPVVALEQVGAPLIGAVQRFVDLTKDCMAKDKNDLPAILVSALKNILTVMMEFMQAMQAVEKPHQRSESVKSGHPHSVTEGHGKPSRSDLEQKHAVEQRHAKPVHHAYTQEKQSRSETTATGSAAAPQGGALPHNLAALQAKYPSSSNHSKKGKKPS